MSSAARIQKVLVFVVPTAVIIAFILVMASGGYIKANSKAGKAIPDRIAKLEILISGEAWEEALTERSALENHWNDLAPMVQISSSQEAIKDFSRALAALKGYLQGKERGLALAKVEVLKTSWDEFDS